MCFWSAYRLEKILPIGRMLVPGAKHHIFEKQHRSHAHPPQHVLEVNRGCFGVFTGRCSLKVSSRFKRKTKSHLMPDPY